MKKILAHYSALKVLVPVAVSSAVGLAIFYFTVWFDGGHLLKYAEDPNRRYWLPILFIAWFCGVVALAAPITLFKRLLFDDSAALWIEQNKLIFFHRWAFSVKCEDIEGASDDERTQVQQKKIVLRMRNGAEREIPTSTLKEPREVILSHLKAELR